MADNPRPPDARLEAAARALADADHLPCWWDDASEAERDIKRSIARHMLRAVDAVDGR